MLIYGLFGGLWLVSPTLVLGQATAPSTDVASELTELDGRYAQIVTDLPVTAERRDWPAVLDAAIPLWCEFWQLPLQRMDDWRVTIYVMSDKAAFARRGLIPAGLPDFPHGYQLGKRAWVVQQPAEYYTQHLLLHEAAHAFAAHCFGGAGPPWYMEGTAEFLATHQWQAGQPGQAGQLTVGLVPPSSAAVPYWGRFKMIQQRRAEGKSLSLISVLRYSDTAHRQVEPYAWTWAAISLLAMYPETRDKLLAAAREGEDASAEFTRRFVSQLGDAWPLAQTRWRVLIDEFDYGYDLQRNRVDLQVSPPVWDGQRRVLEIAAERGWQAAPIQLAAGQQVRVTATGSVTLADQPKPWLSKPAGVTIRYYRGQPLGKLVATLLPLETRTTTTVEPLIDLPIGEQAILRADRPSWLLLRVNDLPGERADNRGSYQVELTPQLSR
ncbi:hypothetical protein SH139x_004768 [Planctomycetaceae bacterium SH139]